MFSKDTSGLHAATWTAPPSVAPGGTCSTAAPAAVTREAVTSARAAAAAGTDCLGPKTRNVRGLSWQKPWYLVCSDYQV